MRMRHVSLLSLALLMAANANAQDFMSKVFITGGVSVGQLKVDDSSFRGPAGAVGFDDEATAWMPTIGADVTRYLSFETGWLTGSVNQSVLASQPTALPGTFVTENDKIRFAAFQASVFGNLPVNDDVFFFARGGLMRWKIKTSVERVADAVSSAGVVTSTTYTYFQGTETGADPMVGVGVGVNIDSGLLRLEYLLSKVDDADVRYISLGIVWRFQPW